MYNLLVLTQSSTAVIGPIAKLLGLIMNGIYNFFNGTFAVVSIGVSIIVFTLLIRFLMLPLAIHQQRTTLAMQKIQPHIKALQDKYKDKKDKESQQKMQIEMSELYKEHNANPAGGCLPLLIQMPILFALFAVLRNIPAYIVKVKDSYQGIVDQIYTVDGYQDKLITLNEGIKTSINNYDPSSDNTVIDLLADLTTKDWLTFHELFSSISTSISTYSEQINHMYNFMGINLSDVPVDFSNGISGIFTIGLIIPILCFVFQFLSMQMTMSKSSAGQNDAQAQSQKTMMYMMPLMTLFFVFNMPAGLGLYWMVGSIFQIGQQIVITKFIND